MDGLIPPYGRADNEPGGLTAIAVGPTIQRVGPLQSRYCYIPKQLFYTAQQSTVGHRYIHIYIIQICEDYFFGFIFVLALRLQYQHRTMIT